jgi:hypothetical protein
VFGILFGETIHQQPQPPRDFNGIPPEGFTEPISDLVANGAAMLVIDPDLGLVSARHRTRRHIGIWQSKLNSVTLDPIRNGKRAAPAFCVGEKRVKIRRLRRPPPI